MTQTLAGPSLIALTAFMQQDTYDLRRREGGARHGMEWRQEAFHIHSCGVRGD